AAAAIASVLAFTGGKPDPRRVLVRPNSVAVVDPHSNRVVGDVPVGQGPSWISAGGGSVWVVNGRDQTISQIDPLERRGARTFAAGGSPAAVLVSGGSLWIVNTVRRGSLVRLDPQGVVEERRPLTLPNIARLLAGAGLEIRGHVWLWHLNELTRVDPTS